MITDQQNLQNLGSAHRLAEQRVGLDQVAEADWSDTDMVNYLGALRDIILQYPQQFNAQTLATAGYLTNSRLNALLEDQSGELPQLQYELTNNVMAAGGDVAKLGQGALHLIGKVGDFFGDAGDAADNAVKAINWIIPIATIGILYLVLTDPGRGSSALGGYTRAARNLAPY